MARKDKSTSLFMAPTVTFSEARRHSLPHGWELVKLGELLTIMKGKRPSDLSARPRGRTLPYLTAEYFRTRKAAEFANLEGGESVVVCSEQDLVIIWDGSNAGEVFTGLKGVLASTMARLDVIDGRVDRTYLYFFLLTQYETLNGQTTGTTIPHVNKHVFAALRVPLPPLCEQRAIAEVLRTVQRAKEATEEVIKALRELKKSLMQRLFTYGVAGASEEGAEDLVKHVALPAPAVVKVKETELGSCPEHWEVVRLEHVARVRGGKRLPKGESFSPVPTDYPYIRVVDLKNLSVQMGDLRYLTAEQHRRLSRYVIEKEDVYISIAGTIGLVGTIPEELHGAHLTENAARLILDRSRLDKQFLVYALSSKAGREQIQTRVTKTSQPKLALGRIKEIRIAFPPLPEQRAIAGILRTVDQRIAAEEAYAHAVDQLFKSLLHELMTGQRRVPFRSENADDAKQGSKWRD